MRPFKGCNCVAIGLAATSLVQHLSGDLLCFSSKATISQKRSLALCRKRCALEEPPVLILKLVELLETLELLLLLGTAVLAALFVDRAEASPHSDLHQTALWSVEKFS